MFRLFSRKKKRRIEVHEVIGSMDLIEHGYILELDYDFIGFIGSHRENKTILDYSDFSSKVKKIECSDVIADLIIELGSPIIKMISEIDKKLEILNDSSVRTLVEAGRMHNQEQEIKDLKRAKINLFMEIQKLYKRVKKESDIIEIDGVKTDELLLKSQQRIDEIKEILEAFRKID